MEAIDTSLCSETWNGLFKQVPIEKLEQMGSGQSFGVCYDIKNVNAINYMAGYDVKDKERAKELCLEVMEIPDNEYAIVKLKGPIPKCIHEGWKYLMEVFFPETGYEHSGDPDFEVYYEGDMSSPEYEMELWVPVRK